jgi:hypothetical protein
VLPPVLGRSHPLLRCEERERLFKFSFELEDVLIEPVDLPLVSAMLRIRLRMDPTRMPGLLRMPPALSRMLQQIWTQISAN